MSHTHTRSEKKSKIPLISKNKKQLYLSYIACWCFAHSKYINAETKEESKIYFSVMQLFNREAKLLKEHQNVSASKP